MNRAPPIERIVQAMGEPLRFALLRRLMEGPATVSALMSSAEAAQSRVSNHLAVLRRCGLVRAERRGRQTVYELAGPPVAQVIESLMALSNARPPRDARTPTIEYARTCYDHLAGKLGVGLFDALLADGAIACPGREDGPAGAGRDAVELGQRGEAVFAGIGIDVAGLHKGRRRFAFACLDWTERRAHLGGALGGALWARLLELGWIVRRPGGRALIVTPKGRTGLRRTFGVGLPDIGRNGRKA